MLRSMYSGISGMKNFQTKLDVIGNNIANVNTYGFKKGRVTFKDAISQSIQGAGGPVTTAGSERGGTNPKQVGLGATIATIDTIDTQGSMQMTGRPLDLAIDGDGYFIVKSGTDTFYTRAGNFYLDQDGTLVTGDGAKVLGIDGAEIKISSDQYTSFTIDDTGKVIGVKKDDGEAEDIATIAIAKFNNPSGLEKVGGNLFKESANSGPGPKTGEYKGAADINSKVATSYLEMSNVDLSEEFTEMIVAQRGFQANTRIITTSDEILQELINLKR